MLKVPDAPTAMILVQNNAEGDVLTCVEGLSFWGGVDPDTGVIIDAHHPDHGACLAGKIVLMPSSRGSCSGSGVLLQLARNGCAPAALVFREDEDILTLGAMIAERLFDRPVAILRLSPMVYDDLSKATVAKISGNELFFDGQAVALSHPDLDELVLNDTDRAMLTGQEGPALQVAMEVLCMMAASQVACDLVDVSRAHIDGCILAHDANLDFAEKMHKMGAKTRIPTTINAISVDRKNWSSQGVVPDFGNKASRLADAYVNMGARATFTCAPYLLDDTPQLGEAIGWSESNAVIYANSVLGARTEKHPDYLDLFIAMTGRAPNTGVYLDANRAPVCELRVVLPETYDDALWPMLGWLAGCKSPSGIPVLTGLEHASPSSDDLKALCAAFGTTSAAPMLHVRGHTPEGEQPLVAHAAVFDITPRDLALVWQEFNTGDAEVDLVAIGSPHASLSECRKLAEFLHGKTCDPQTAMIVTVGRKVLEDAVLEGIVDVLRCAGAQVIADICWCSITEPVFPPETKILMTNSGKYSHYANGLTGCEVRFGSLEECVQAAVTGHAGIEPPSWLL
ncbi:putative aconitase subunit 1 [Litoreibacter halocynthiae]|uniref:Putative aconitase subunit 1 n=1 Tax=Litoreibacter halocynthiae TaxID=1242689 RepID=A0A4R7LS79_9RHOB|nr:putative aconitase subunit 1 [Litoreibacter halocynthiae]